MTAPDQTPDEQRLAERYLRVLDYVSRCADAVRQGNWAELRNAAQSLARRAEQLAEAAHDRHDSGIEPRAHVVVSRVAKHSGYEAVTAVHSYRPGMRAQGMDTTATPLATPAEKQPTLCRETTKKGRPCIIDARPSGLCHVHDPAVQCGAIKKNGQRCVRPSGGGRCPDHRDTPSYDNAPTLL